MPESAMTGESLPTTDELTEALSAIDALARYVHELEEALMEAPLIDPIKAHTMTERHTVQRQEHWMRRHADVLARARGSVVDKERERAMARTEFMSKVRLVASRIRMMDMRVELGDVTATSYTGGQAVDMIEKELLKL